MSRGYPQMRLRMPIELQDNVKESAKTNNRTLNAEINYRLEQSFNHETTLSEISRKLDLLLAKK